MKQILLLFLIGLAATCNVPGDSVECGRISLTTPANSTVYPPYDIKPLWAQPPIDVREWYSNVDGSCVQFAFGVHGVRNNNLNVSTLPFDSHYGPAIRGGSTPSRVAEYCNARGIKAFNVTGDGTIAWAKYAALTGRGAAIGFGYRHYQTLQWYDEANDIWYVCDPNEPSVVNKYNTRQFTAMHEESGKWIIVLDGPAPSPMPTTLAVVRPKCKFPWLSL